MNEFPWQVGLGHRTEGEFPWQLRLLQWLLGTR